MELFRYYGYMYGERIVGIVKANTLQEAKDILKTTYDDYDGFIHSEFEGIDANLKDVSLSDVTKIVDMETNQVLFVRTWLIQDTLNIKVIRTFD